MKFYLIFVLIAAIGCDQDVAIVRKCLMHANVKNRRNTLEDLQKVAHYSNWTVEEVPCFTRCISTEKGWFNIEESKWNKQQIVDDLGEDMYNYCRYELDRPFTNVCDFAHKGLRCLKQAEIYVRETYANVLNCAITLNASMEHLQQYSLFTEDEKIPCLYKCFADKMNFYTSDYEWNFEKWIQAFGPVKYEVADAFKACKANADKIQKLDKCAWMYEEYICVERLNYNTDGSIGDLSNSMTTLKSVIDNEITKNVKADENESTTENNEV